MTLHLVVSAGPHAGRIFSFDQHATFMVGRAPDAHFSLAADPYFSRYHFMIEVNPPLCRLTDLKSRNGTLVNGHKVQVGIELKDGDEIKGGQTVLQVQQEKAAVEEATLDLPASQADLAPSTVAAWAAVSTDTGLPVLPGYQIASRLGKGGMGIVYRARRDADGSAVAVKTIRPTGPRSEVTVKRFLREAEILKVVRHPSIVSFHELGEANGLLYFVMELVEGIDAARAVSRRGPFSVAQAVSLTQQVLAGLDHAHRLGFVHRDIKPANILLHPGPQGEAAKLADFGLARVYQDSPLSGLTMSGVAGGTPLYMPPEQITDFRKVKPAADQYSAAAMLYNLLTGKHGHKEGPANEMLLRMMTEDPAPIRSHRPELPESLAVVVHRALARSPDARYPDVMAFSRALAPFG